MSNNFKHILNDAMKNYYIIKLNRNNISDTKFVLHVTFDGIIVVDEPMTIKQLAEIMNKRFDQVDMRLDRVEKRLDAHDVILKEHSEILKRHSEILERHSEILERHSEILERHSDIFERNNLK